MSFQRSGELANILIIAFIWSLLSVRRGPPWPHRLGQVVGWSSLRHTRAAASARSHGADCGADDVDDRLWRGDAGRVIDSVCPYSRLHALRHVALRLSDDHAVIFGKQKPTRDILPKRAPDWNGDAV